MSKLVIIAVFIFWAAVSFFYANSLVKNNVVLNNSLVGNNKQLEQNTKPDQWGTTLASQLALHNTRDDCWLTIDGKVYEVTNYIFQHPGGAQEIIKSCGQDATKAFTSKDKFIPQDHSAAAYAMLKNYYIGDLNTQIR